MTVRTRFAPSPTGLLHAGGARTALFNYLFAKHFSGTFILRIEDTDPERSKKEFERFIVEDLLWLGLEPDEGPTKGGGFGPYRQSERRDIYKEYADRLLKKGAAYRCYCTKDRLEALKREQLGKGLAPRYDGRCRDLKESERPEDTPFTLRFRVPETDVRFTDGVHGPMSFYAGDIGDFIIVDQNGRASYNLVVVVDDSLMKITHVLRGDDHLSNTPRQILIFRALGLNPPEYFHLPLVLSPEGSPLGKRKEDASIRRLREEGFLPEALLNLLARLGWSPGEGFLTIEEMAARFSGEGLSKSPSVFDITRLRSYNAEAIRRKGAREILNLLDIREAGLDRERFLRAVELVKTNAVTLKDIADLALPLAGRVTYTKEALEVLKGPGAEKVLRALEGLLEKTGELNAETYDGIIAGLRDLTGRRGRNLFMPIRAALTGRTEGIELEKVFNFLGKKGVLERLKEAVDICRKDSGTDR